MVVQKIQTGSRFPSVFQAKETNIAGTSTDLRVALWQHKDLVGWRLLEGDVPPISGGLTTHAGAMHITRALSTLCPHHS